MLISFDYIFDKYNLKIKGILHIGAHECEELGSYLKHNISIDNQLWLEAIPEKVNFCVENFKNINIVNVIISDKDNETVTFNVTNNYQSSSILNLKTHLIEHPHIHVTNTFEGKTKTVKTIYDENTISYDKYNFINLDIQGAEYKALLGMGDILNNIDYVYTEVNTKELYENCVLLDDLDKFLQNKGFHRVEICMTNAIDCATSKKWL
jgi:FkbM family methyltransferase